MKKMRKLYNLLNQKEDCVLLVRNSEDGDFYKVIDVESDTVYMGYDKSRATKLFESYDLETVRKEKKRLFYKWLENNAEA